MVLFKTLFFCFFQAEDGIRDLVRSRGLGDVYKRQRKQIMCSRSFEKTKSQKSELQEVLSNFVSDVAEKLREQKSLALSLIHI